MRLTLQLPFVASSLLAMLSFLCSLVFIAACLSGITLGSVDLGPALNKHGGCHCRDNLNKDIIASIDKCVDAIKLETSSGCHGIIQSIKGDVSVYLLMSSSHGCRCGAKVTKDLLEMLQNCVQTLDDMEGCTAGPPPPASSSKSATIAPSTTAASSSVAPTTVASTSRGPPNNPPITSSSGPTVSPTATPAFPSSCNEIKKKFPKKKSGYYHIQTKKGKVRKVYCLMGKLCGVFGGWTKIAHFNAIKANSCPKGFQFHKQGQSKACGRMSTKTSSCQSLNFPVGFDYQRACGRVFGHQLGHTSALYNGAKTIDGPYVDGISLTHGSPRKHIWTFMSSFSAIQAKYTKLNCPCSKGSIQKVPSFIGNDYFCESGLHTKWHQKFYTKMFPDRLWNRINCGVVERPCCIRKDLPWFNKVLTAGTTDEDIEFRLCGTGGTDKKDTPFYFYDIFVK